jgi:hypothetical protein
LTQNLPRPEQQKSSRLSQVSFATRKPLKRLGRDSYAKGLIFVHSLRQAPRGSLPRQKPALHIKKNFFERQHYENSIIFAATLAIATPVKAQVLEYDPGQSPPGYEGDGSGPLIQGHPQQVPRSSQVSPPFSPPPRALTPEEQKQNSQWKQRTDLCAAVSNHQEGYGGCTAEGMTKIEQKPDGSWHLKEGYQVAKITASAACIACVRAKLSDTSEQTKLTTLVGLLSGMKVANPLASAVCAFGGAAIGFMIGKVTEVAECSTICKQNTTCEKLLVE